MHVYHVVPSIARQLVEDRIAQDAGVVDDAVESTEGVDRRLHHALGAGRVGHAVAVDDRAPARALDLVDDRARRAGIGTLALGVGAQVVDDDGRALARRQQGDLAPYASARARDQDDLAGQALGCAHAVSSERPEAGRSRPPPMGVKQSGQATFA